MAHNHYEEEFPIIHRLEIISLFAAIFSIPFIVFQAGESELLHRIGDIGSLIVWIYFVTEITFLLRIWEDNIEFLRGHLLEVCVVVASSPFFVLAYEAESLFGIAPLLRIIRFVKFSKIFKLVKSGKIAQKSKIPEVALWIVWISVIVTSVGLAGMILDHHAHSLVEGFEYWGESARHGFNLKIWTLIPCSAALLVGGIVVHRAHAQQRSPYVSPNESGP